MKGLNILLAFWLNSESYCPVGYTNIVIDFHLRTLMLNLRFSSLLITWYKIKRPGDNEAILLVMIIWNSISIGRNKKQNSSGHNSSNLITPNLFSLLLSMFRPLQPLMCPVLSFKFYVYPVIQQINMTLNLVLEAEQH